MEDDGEGEPTGPRGIDLADFDSLEQIRRTGETIARTTRPLSAVAERLRAAMPSESLRQAAEAAHQWERAMGPIRDVQERMKSLSASFAAGSSMGALADEIARQGRTLDALRPSALDMASFVSPEPPRLPPNPVYETNERLARIEGQFGELQGLAVGYATVANRLQAAVAELVAKFDRAAADTTRSARVALTISVAATLLTLLGVIVPIAYSEFRQAPAEAAEASAFRDRIAAEISGMRQAQEDEANRLIEAIRVLGTADQQRLDQLLEALRAERPTTPAAEK